MRVLDRGTCQQLGIKASGAVVVIGGTSNANADGSTTLSSSGANRDVEVRLSPGKFWLVGESVDFAELGGVFGTGVVLDGGTVGSSAAPEKSDLVNCQFGGLGLLRANSVTVYFGMKGGPVIRLNDAMLDGASAPIAHVDVYEDEQDS